VTGRALIGSCARTLRTSSASASTLAFARILRFGFDDSPPATRCPCRPRLRARRAGTRPAPAWRPAADSLAQFLDQSPSFGLGQVKCPIQVCAQARPAAGGRCFSSRVKARVTPGGCRADRCAPCPSPAARCVPRDIAHGCNFGEGQAAKVLQIHDLRDRWLDLCELSSASLKRDSSRSSMGCSPRSVSTT
jgi:hypothetical protein